MNKLKTVLGVAIIGAVAAVAAVTTANGKEPIPPVASVDLERFMGDWYVIGNIPTFIEKDVYDAVESYALDKDGKIRTTFRYRKGSFDAPIKTMNPVGTVVEGTNNAVWGMQFIWPIKAEYVIVHLSEDYSQTIIGRTDRDYVWIMARTPQIPDADYQALVQRVRDLGYDTTHLRKVPQSPR